MRQMNAWTTVHDGTPRVYRAYILFAPYASD
jgi:hypothetical protein